MESLCNTCAKATPLLCRWIDAGDRTGLEYKSKFAKYTGKGKSWESELVTVIRCQRYKKGPLPPIGIRRIS